MDENANIRSTWVASGARGILARRSGLIVRGPMFTAGPLQHLHDCGQLFQRPELNVQMRASEGNNLKLRCEPAREVDESICRRCPGKDNLINIDQQKRETELTIPISSRGEPISTPSIASGSWDGICTNPVSLVIGKCKSKHTTSITHVFIGAEYPGSSD